jgi:hypothetical protein
METFTIPAEQWTQFCDALSRERVGWMATIRVLHGQHGPQKIAMNLPFEGISFDSKGTRPSSVLISAGSAVGVHASHVVDLPLNIRQTEEPNGSIDIQIEPATGPVTLLHLRGPVV